MGLDLEGYVVAWDATTVRLLDTLQPEGHPVGFNFTPDGGEIVLAPDIGSGLVAYSTKTWKRTRAVADDPAYPEGSQNPIGYVDGGATLITASGFSGATGGWLYRRDAATFAIETRTRVSSGSLKSASMDDAGTMLATGAADGTVRLWDLRSLALIHELHVPGQVQGLAFIDAAHLAVLPERGDVLVMTLDPDELMRLVRSGVTRAMTPEECSLYGIDPCPSLAEVRAGP